MGRACFALPMLRREFGVYHARTVAPASVASTASNLCGALAGGTPGRPAGGTQGPSAASPARRTWRPRVALHVESAHSGVLHCHGFAIVTLHTQ